MTLLLILVVAVGIGVGIRRWWALLLPVSIGAVSSAVMSLSGHGLRDTPIAFLVAIATGATALGVFLRTRQLRSSF